MGRLVSVVLHGRVVLSFHGTNGRGTLVSPLPYCFLAMVHDAHVGDRPVGYGSFGGLLLRHSVGLLPACQLARVVVVDAPSAFVVFLFFCPYLCSGLILSASPNCFPGCCRRQHSCSIMVYVGCRLYPVLLSMTCHSIRSRYGFIISCLFVFSPHGCMKSV